ncbi:MAG: B12-binding domain-containing radical SAM protein, partial [Alphaproteobacteria bacterium]
YDCQPLPTNHLKGEDVLDFRDAAFDEYFNNPSYLAMIDKTYGPKVRGHISEMAAHTLKRKHHA